MLKNISNVRTAKTDVIPKQYYGANEKKEHNRNPVKMLAGMVTGFLLVTTCGVLASGYSLGYTVEVENTVVGTVAAKREYYEVLDEVKTEVKDMANVEFEPIGEESFRVEIVKRSELTNKEELAENLKATQDGMVEAASIVGNGTFFAAVAEEHAAYNLLEKYLSGYTAGKENITAEFAEEVTVSYGYVPAETVRTPEEVYADLLAGKTVTHIVAEGETLEHIASVYQTTEETIKDTNAISSETLYAGRSLLIYTGEPVFSIRTVEHINEEIDIPFEVVQKKDTSLYQGRTEIEIQGVLGVQYKEAYITKINGEVVEEQVISDRVIQEPVAQVERIGTKKAPPSVGTGTFAMPTSGTLTSSYGARWGRTHAGIDVGAKTGTPIYAADNGVVTEAQFKNNGYGNFIAIDHGNGFVTYYAHCSELLVRENDVVAKGDLIAKVGNTGRSTGPHLHFEVRLNGEAQNPMQYVK